MNELSVTRFIAAPPPAVWDAMVNRMEEWFCPRPWRAVPGVQERRPGGRAQMIMHGPDGEVMDNDGIYLAWDEGRRFAFTDAVTAGLQPAGPFMIGIFEIAPEGDGTRYTAIARHWSQEACQQHETMGFSAGWGAAADQLVALCEG